jgi:hypothetical protein
MLSLEVGDPGDSLSTLLICHVRLAGCQSESVLAGGNNDGGPQVATGRWRRSSIGWGTANDDHGLGVSVPVGDGLKLFVLVLYLCSYSALIVPNLLCF